MTRFTIVPGERICAHAAALIADEDGATLAEYALLAGLLGLGSIAALVLMSSNLNSLLTGVAASLTAAANAK